MKLTVIKPKPVEPRYSIELSYKEASDLRGIFENVAFDDFSIAEKLYDFLSINGVETIDVHYDEYSELLVRG